VKAPPTVARVPPPAVRVPPARTPPPVAKPPEPAPSPPPVWPSLVLSGVVGKGNNGSAIINGEVVGIGEVIEGVKVTGIRKQGADLEYQGDVRYLKVGGSLK
jgi:hypothetical protein